MWTVFFEICRQMGAENEDDQVRGGDRPKMKLDESWTEWGFWWF